MEVKYLRFLLPLRCFLFITAGLLLSIMLSTSSEELNKWWTIIVSVCNIITIALLLFFCQRNKTTYGEFVNYKKGKTSIKSVIITAFVILVVGMGGMQLAGIICYGEIPHFPIIMIQPIPLWLAIMNIIVLPLTTTLAEDGIYLGAIKQNDSKHIIILSAFFYAFQHSFIPFIPDVSFIIYRFLSFLPLAIIMCLWYRKTKNPLPFMVGHFIINLATVAQIVMTSASPDLFEHMKSFS
jgi:hypothetical protein